MSHTPQPVSNSGEPIRRVVSVIDLLAVSVDEAIPVPTPRRRTEPIFHGISIEVRRSRNHKYIG